MCGIQPICIFSKYALKTRKYGSSRKCTPGPQEQTNIRDFCFHSLVLLWNGLNFFTSCKKFKPWLLFSLEPLCPESPGSLNYSWDMHYICNTTIFVQVLDLNDPKLVQAIWKPEVPNQNCQAFFFCKICVFSKWYFLGVLPKCEGGRVPVCDRSKSFAQHQTPRTDTLHAQVLIQDKHKHKNSIKPLGQIFYMIRYQFKTKTKKIQR